MRVLIWMVMVVWVAQAAVVPDGRAARPDDGAPELPKAASTTQVKVRSTSSATGKNQRKPRVNAAAPASPTSSGSSVNAGSSSYPTTSDPLDASQNPADAKPLAPLAPTALQNSKNAPLWTALGLFVVLAIAGFWLAQQRNQD